MIYILSCNQPIKSTIHLFGEVEANALYLKKNKIKTKNKLKNTSDRWILHQRGVFNRYQPETEKKCLK